MDIELRRLTENELELMMNWRMREDITRTMFTDVMLTLDTQKKWFQKIKNSDKEIRWIIWKDGDPIGSMYAVDIDRINNRCETGWFVAEKEGMDIKTVMGLQQNLCDYVFDVLQLNRIYGLVMGNNQYLVRLLQMCGFNKEGVFKQHIFKNGEYYDVISVGLTKDEWSEKKQKIQYPHISIE